MIPKRIFYIWITSDESNPGLPSQYMVALDQWKSIAKPELGWEYIFVDWNYMKANYGDEVIAEMRRVGSIEKPAIISDYCRFVLTSTKGGFYMDLDTVISPKFLDLVNSESPIISRKPFNDVQFMCHPGGGRCPVTMSEGYEIYKDYGKYIVGNYAWLTPSRNNNYLRNKMQHALTNRLGLEPEICSIDNFDEEDGTHAAYLLYFYPNQPLFHFRFNAHDGVKSGFEEEFKRWKTEFLSYYESHHD